MGGYRQVGWRERETLECAIRDLHLSAQFLLITVTVLTRLDQERARSSHVVEQGKGRERLQREPHPSHDYHREPCQHARVSPRRPCYGHPHRPP